MTLHMNWASLIRFVAYMVGFAVSAIFLLFLIGEGLAEITSGRLDVLVLSLLVATAGLFISLNRKYLGSIITLLGSLISGLLAVWIPGSRVRRLRAGEAMRTG